MWLPDLWKKLRKLIDAGRRTEFAMKRTKNKIHPPGGVSRATTRSFAPKVPDKISRLYFPLCNEAVLCRPSRPGSAVTSKTGIQLFLTLPVSAEDLHNTRSGTKISGVEGSITGNPWSVVGVLHKLPRGRRSVVAPDDPGKKACRVAGGGRQFCTGDPGHSGDYAGHAYQYQLTSFDAFRPWRRSRFLAVSADNLRDAPCDLAATPDPAPSPRGHRPALRCPF